MIAASFVQGPSEVFPKYDAISYLQTADPRGPFKTI